MLHGNDPARNLIREDRLHQLFAVMDAGAGRGAAISLNAALASLCRQGRITLDDAVAASNEPGQLRKMVGSATNGRG